MTLVEEFIVKSGTGESLCRSCGFRDENPVKVARHVHEIHLSEEGTEHDIVA